MTMAHARWSYTTEIVYTEGAVDDISCGMPPTPDFAAHLCDNACLPVLAIFPVPLQCLVTIQELSRVRAVLEVLCRCWHLCLLFCLATLSLSSAERHLLQTQNMTAEGSTATRGVVYCKPRTLKASPAWEHSPCSHALNSLFQAVCCARLL